MCLFTGPVQQVSSTRIFGRALEDGSQLLVYRMAVALDEDVAMVLPVPTPPNPDDDAVQFIDLSACPGFFDIIGTHFPAEPVAEDLAAPPRPAALEVHNVGAYEASFVPRRADFVRLDERFRLPRAVWAAMPTYDDWSFCVFKLRAVPRRFWQRNRAELRGVHPMAFLFPRRDRTTLFFPTTHLHDGRVHGTAEFDHTLYAQPDPGWEPFLDWERSPRPVSGTGEETRYVATGRYLWRRRLRGRLPNRDTVLHEDVLRCRGILGRHHRLRIRPDGDVSRSRLIDARDRMASAVETALTETTHGLPLIRFAHDLPVSYPAVPASPVPDGAHLATFTASATGLGDIELALACDLPLDAAQLAWVKDLTARAARAAANLR